MINSLTIMRYLLVSIDKTDKKEITVPDEIIVKKEPNSSKAKKRKITAPLHSDKKVQIAKPIVK